ncbi:hypothetical protein ACWEQL_10110 [Kitasatospora sp. NPDC004240]
MSGGAQDPAGGTGGSADPVTVADYWRGDFTLRGGDGGGYVGDGDDDSDGGGGGAGPEESSLRRLGPSGITVRGRDLAVLLAPAYDAFRD